MFYYYGAKARLAGKYPMPRHDLIIEPFAGSAGYTVHHLAAGNAKKALLVEKDPRVVEVWHRLLGMTPAEVLALPVPEVGTQTEDFLVMCAATSNALQKMQSFKVSERAAGVFEMMKRRIARYLPYVQGRVEVVHADYREIGETPIEATWFVDPPYQVVDREKTTSLPRGMGYAAGCDAAAMDYFELGAWCQRRRGQVIVCEMDGATWLPFVPLSRHQNSSGALHHEVIWEGGL